MSQNVLVVLIKGVDGRFEPGKFMSRSDSSVFLSRKLGNSRRPVAEYPNLKSEVRRLDSFEVLGIFPSFADTNSKNCVSPT